MKYIEIHFKWTDEALNAEVVTAFIAELAFESFEEGEQELKAFIQTDDFVKADLDEILASFLTQVTYDVNEVEDRNWNEVWESNYDAVFIKDECHIRAPFHDKKPEFKYEIEIEPQMSFGTAHHETTSMILEYTLEHSFEGNSVLDMGCGTGVLAILAAMKGAKGITAIDNDEWAYKNSLKNVKRNGFPEIEVIHGDASDLKGKSFDVVFANINRNILINDMEAYVQSMNDSSRIFFSGFYLEDLPIIQEKAESLNLVFQNHKQKGKWIAASFTKNNA